MRSTVEQHSKRDIFTAVIAFIGVGLIGFDASPFGPAPMYSGICLLLVGLPLLRWDYVKNCIKDPVALLIFVLIAWVIIRGLFDLFLPTMDPAHYNAEDWWYHFRASGPVALLIGLWIAAVPRSAWIGVGAMVLALIIHPLLMEVWSHTIDPLWFSRGRLRLGESPNLLGNYTAVMSCIGILAVFFGVGYAINRSYKWYYWLFPVLGLTIFIAYFLMLIASGSRSSWLAFFITIVFTLIVLIRKFLSYYVFENKVYFISLIGFIILLLILITLPVKHRIIERFAAEYTTIKAIANLQTEDIEIKSWGKRWLMWSNGAKMIKARPFSGWGPGFISNARSTSPYEEIKHGTQYHNTYIHMAVSMGLVWIVLWVALHVILLIRATKSVDKINIDTFITMSGICLILVFLVSGVAEYRLHSYKGFATYLFASSLVVGKVLSKYNIAFASQSTSE